MKIATLDSLVIEEACIPTDLWEIQRFRYRIYIQEMGLELPGADHVSRTLSDPLDATGIHIVARLGSNLVGAVRLNLNAVPLGLETALQAASLPTPFVYCSRLCVADDLRGRGVMKQLADMCFEQFYEVGAAVAICHCYPHLFSLYERLGFQSYGSPFFSPGLEDQGMQTPFRRLLTKRQPLRVA